MSADIVVIGYAVIGFICAAVMVWYMYKADGGVLNDGDEVLRVGIPVFIFWPIVLISVLIILGVTSFIEYAHTESAKIGDGNADDE